MAFRSNKCAADAAVVLRYSVHQQKQHQIKEEGHLFRLPGKFSRLKYWQKQQKKRQKLL